MSDRFAFKDGRAYVHLSDILPHVVDRFASTRPSRIVIDLHQPTVCQVQWVRRGPGESLAQDTATLTAKVYQGDVCQTWDARPVPADRVVDRVMSQRCVVEERYFDQGFDMVSMATDRSTFVLDLISCMKAHWRQFYQQAGAPLTRRAEVMCPLVLPTGHTVQGRLRKRRTRVQSWHFSAPSAPGFDLAIVGMLLDAGLNHE